MTVSVNPLRDVVAAETMLGLVDGEQGRLLYRGIPATRLAEERSFWEVAHLLWTGRLPSAEDEADLARRWRAGAVVPPYLAAMMDALPVETPAMQMLASLVAAVPPTQEWPPSVDDAVRLAALVPALIVRWQERLSGRLSDGSIFSHDESPVGAYLAGITGSSPSAAHVRALEAYMILTMEHGLNASTFAARVAASTQADLTAALTAALATMRGPLHGGAPSAVQHMLDAIGSADRAEAYLRRELNAGHRLMGFGHRIYKTRDPRAAALNRVVSAVAAGDPALSLAVMVQDVAEALLQEYKPGRHLYANVEYWAGAVLKTVGIPRTLYTATFSAARTVGWTAHVLEQAPVNRLIRPQSQYVGPGVD